MTTHLNSKRIALASGLTLGVWHIIGYLYMYLFFADNALWMDIYALMHPGGTWLTVGGFFIGLVEALIFGALIGYVFGAFYNLMKD